MFRAFKSFLFSYNSTLDWLKTKPVILKFSKFYLFIIIEYFSRPFSQDRFLTSLQLYFWLTVWLIDVVDKSASVANWNFEILKI